MSLQITNSKGAACFLTVAEKAAVLAGRDVPELQAFRQALKKRVTGRLGNKGLLGPADNTAWWYVAFEYISDAAMHFALFPDEPTGIWLKEAALEIARKPAADWVGPWFRSHSQPFSGHLETAHLCWALASAIDLAAGAFTPAELAEVKDALAQKGIPLCRQWLGNNNHLANWRGIMLAGVLVPAAVLGDVALLDAYAADIPVCLSAFQPDGSYAESLQYGNYLAFALMLVYESLSRKYPARAAGFNIAAYGKGVEWIASSMFYAKPLPGWGAEPRARAANFNDSAAMFRPSGDLLLHLAVHCQAQMPTQAALAGYLFETYYQALPEQGPHNLASFGFINDWGFLTLPLLTYARNSVSPETANLPLTTSFSNGNAFYRDAWNGQTILAIQGGAGQLNAPGHLHGDVNSFILAYNDERLLVDPGHSCYRNLIHGLESASQTHNTCTFLLENEQLGLQEDAAKSKLLEQQSVPQRRLINAGMAGEPVVRGNKHLITARLGEVSAIGAEASALYKEIIKEYARFWISAGSRVTFVIDRIEASVPVKTGWNWVFNNRDGRSELKRLTDGSLQLRRPRAGLRVFSCNDQVAEQGPVYGFMHDAYHPEPDQKGEGHSGSALICRWTETQAKTFRLGVHVFIADLPDAVNRWQTDWTDGTCRVHGAEETWSLTLLAEQPLLIRVTKAGSPLQWQLEERAGQFLFTEINLSANEH